MREMMLVSHVVNASVSEGFLPAAQNLGLHVVLLTDCAEQQRQYFSQPGLPAYPDEIISCDVFNPVSLIETIAERNAPPQAIFSNSDHLQTSTAIAADYFSLPGKDWQVTYRAKNKAQMRAYMKANQIDQLWHATVSNAQALTTIAKTAPYPCVVKPREGVASEQVSLVSNASELEAYCSALWHRQPEQVLLIEAYLSGELYTLETLGDGQQLQVLGGFKVALSSPPSFVELQANWGTGLSEAQHQAVVEQISQFGIGFGACHTEFVMTENGPRLIEINYRSIGDRRDLLMQDVLGMAYFEHVIRLYMGEPLPSLQQQTRAAAIHYFTTGKEGKIFQLPDGFNFQEKEISLRYESLKKKGDQLTLTHSNRDYLGVMSAIGPDAEQLSEVMGQHSANLNWEIHP